MPHTTPLKKFTFNYTPLNCEVPRIPIRFIGNDDKKTPIIYGVLDSGADEITIPKELSDWLKLELLLREEPIHTAMGEKEAHSTKLDFILFRGGKAREVNYKDVEVCVIDGCPHILVGIEPIFKDFKITIIGYQKKVIFEPRE